MSNIPKKKIRDFMVAQDVWHDEWTEFLLEKNESGDDYDDDTWDNWIQQLEDTTWQFDLIYSQLKQEGWTYIKINPAYKDATVTHWLDQQGAEYKHDRLHFLIKEKEVATMTLLRWA